jgi:hypothetical protein
MNRHDRQARLAEVGAAGQRRVAAATIEVRAGAFAAEVATRYLAGAGVGRLRVHDGALAAAAAAIDPAVSVEVEEPRASLAAEGLRASSTAEGPRMPSPVEAEASAGFHDPSAREAMRGAREALRALRAILEGTS